MFLLLGRPIFSSKQSSSPSFSSKQSKRTFRASRGSFVCSFTQDESGWTRKSPPLQRLAGAGVLSVGAAVPVRLSEVILIMIHWILVDQFIVPIRSNNCSLLGPVNLWISRCYFLGVCKPARVSRTSMQGGPPKIANLVYNFVNWSYLGSMEERTNIVTVIRVYKPTRITLGYFVPKPSQTMAVLCSSILSHWRASLHIKGSKSNSWSSRVSGAGPKILGRTVSDYRNSIMSTPDS